MVQAGTVYEGRLNRRQRFILFNALHFSIKGQEGRQLWGPELLHLATTTIHHFPLSPNDHAPLSGLVHFRLRLLRRPWILPLWL